MVSGAAKAVAGVAGAWMWMHVGTGIADLVILVVLSVICAAITHQLGRFIVWTVKKFWQQLIIIGLCFAYLYAFISIYYYVRQ